jgi:hypothetical protein
MIVNGWSLVRLALVSITNFVQSHRVSKNVIRPQIQLHFLSKNEEDSGKNCRTAENELVSARNVNICAREVKKNGVDNLWKLRKLLKVSIKDSVIDNTVSSIPNPYRTDTEWCNLRRICEGIIVLL